ncbi:MAG TPA: hypothetical protein PK916_08460 [Bacteroidota bacterium]|nr:hypothetical protein [Bacteroidota bacterium]
MCTRAMFLLALAGAVLLGGCLEVTSTTVVYEDGSIVRSIAMSGDSSELFRGPLPFDLDSGWSVATRTHEGGRVYRRAERRFEDVAEMNAALRGREGRTFEIEATLTRHFDWFYTVHRYEETWKRFDPFNAVPVTDFLTEAEIQALRQHHGDETPMAKADSLSLADAEQRLEQWQQRNMSERFLQIVDEGARRIVDTTSLDIHALRSQKDSLVQNLEELDSDADPAKPETLPGLLATPEVRRALAANPEGFREFIEKKHIYETLLYNSYAVGLRMPGMLQQTNARELRAGRCEWKDFIGPILITDITLTAESRSVNWTFIIAATLLLLLLIALSLWRYLRR